MTQNKALKKIVLIDKELKIPIYVIRLWEKKINILNQIFDKGNLTHSYLNQDIRLRLS